MNTDDLDPLRRKELFWSQRANLESAQHNLDEKLAQARRAIDEGAFANARRRLLEVRQIEAEGTEIAARINQPFETDQAARAVQRAINEKRDEMLQRADLAVPALRAIFEGLADIERDFLLISTPSIAIASGNGESMEVNVRQSPAQPSADELQALAEAYKLLARIATRARAEQAAGDE